MREAAVLAVVALLVLAAGVAALRAVLDGRRVGLRASIAVVAPLAETARLLRTRSIAGSASPWPAVAGTGFVLAAVLRVLALPIVSTPLLGEPLGLGWFVVADLLWWGIGVLLAPAGTRWRTLGRAAVVELPLLVVLGTVAVAAGGIGLDDALVAQQRLLLAAEAPVAALLLLVVGGVLLPWAVPGPRGSGVGRLLVAVGRAVQLVSSASVAAVLFLGAGGTPSGAAALAGETALLAVLLVLAPRRLPVLRPPRVTRVAATVLLPLAAVQLAVVAALTILGG